jgi:ABC-2 type transport system permease protein
MRSTALLAVRWRGWANALRRRRAATLGRTAVLALFAACWSIAIAGAVDAALRAPFGLAAQAPEARRLIETYALSLAITGIAVLALLAAGSAPAALLAPSVDRLLVAPVEPRRIVRATLIAHAPQAIALVVPGLLACAFSVASVTGALVPAFVVAILLCIPLGALVLATAALISTAVARVLSRRRAMAALEMTGAVVAVALGIALLWSGADLAGAISHLRAHPHDAPPALVRACLWLPSGWAARAFDAAARGDGVTTALAVAALGVLAVVALWGAQESGAVLYRRGWTPRETALAGSALHGRAGRGTWPRGHVRALIVKDLLLARRTPQIVWGWASVLVSLALAAVFTRDMPAVHALAPRLASFWIGYDVGARIFSIDRTAFWSLVAAPLRARDIVTGKALSACAMALPASVIGCAALAVMDGARPAHVARETIAGALFAVAGAACGIPIGALWTNFGWRRRADMLTAVGRWTVVVIFAAPLVLLHALARLGATWGMGPWGALVVAVVCCASALPAATRRIGRLQWMRSNAG